MVLWSVRCFSLVRIKSHCQYSLSYLLCLADVEKCQLQICIENAETEALGPLRLDVVHTPSLPTMDMESGDCWRWQPVALNPGHLCVESLAQHAIEVRIAARLQSVFKYLQQFPLYQEHLRFDQDSLHLLLDVGDDPESMERLMIYVESHTGSFRAKILPEDPAKLVKTLEIVPLLNKAPCIDLVKRIDRLRARLVLSHCRRKMESRGWSVYAHLPMASIVTVLSKLGHDYVFVKLARQPVGYLVSPSWNYKKISLSTSKCSVAYMVQSTRFLVMHTTIHDVFIWDHWLYACADAGEVQI